jgi:hypothetical protein
MPNSGFPRFYRSPGCRTSTGRRKYDVGFLMQKKDFMFNLNKIISITECRIVVLAITAITESQNAAFPRNAPHINIRILAEIINP